MLSGQFPPGKLPIGQGWGLDQGQGQFQGWEATRQLPPRKIVLWLGLGFGLGLVLGLEVIFLGCNCPRTQKNIVLKKTLIKNQLKENGEAYLNSKTSKSHQQNTSASHSEAAVRRCSSKQVLLMLHHIHRKAPVLKSLFNKLY